MDKINIEKGFEFTKDDLLSLGIYELRELGRDVGVCSPTTLKKESLADAILSVIYGETPARKVGKGRGRPTRRSEKPSRLFLDLIDKSNSPRCETNIIGEDAETCFTARVASFGREYQDDEDAGVGVVSSGIICEEEDGFFVRKYKFVKSDTDLKIDDSLVQAYKIKDSDVVEYFSTAGTEVTEIIKINGFNTFLKSENVNKIINEKSKELLEDVDVSMGESNLIVSNGEQKTLLFNKFSDKLLEKGYFIIKLNLTSLSSIGKNVFTDRYIEYFINSICDEYETVAIVEQAMEGAKTLCATKEKVVLLVDDICWLKTAVDSYPKSVYGTLIHKFAGLTKNNINATIIGFAVKGSEKIQELESVFDNKIEI